MRTVLRHAQAVSVQRPDDDIGVYYSNIQRLDPLATASFASQIDIEEKEGTPYEQKKQTEKINHFTQQSLNSCVKKLETTLDLSLVATHTAFQTIMKDLSAEILQGIRLDILDKLKSQLSFNKNESKHTIFAFSKIKEEINLETKYCKMKDLFSEYQLLAIDTINKSIYLKKDECFVYEFYKKQPLYEYFLIEHSGDKCKSDSDNENDSENKDDRTGNEIHKKFIGYNLLLCTVTNYSNVCLLNSTYKCEDALYCIKPNDMAPTTIFTDYPLHDIFINTLNCLNVLMESKILITIEDFTIDQFEKEISKLLLGIIQEIININKETYIHFINNIELQKQHEQTLRQIQEMKEKIKELEKDYLILEEQLKESIPKEYQCCICFGFTDKKHFIVPCGHSQYCKGCISIIDKCAMCNSKNERVQKIY
jgi:hypothetical protein